MDEKEVMNQEMDKDLMLARIYENSQRTYFTSMMILREVAMIKAENMGADGEKLYNLWKEAIDNTYDLSVQDLAKASKERLTKP